MEPCQQSHFKGVVDNDRSIRLAAGRALKVLLEASSSGGSTVATSERATLGRPNPIVQRLAYVKWIAKKHNNTPLSMVQPYLDQIAPFLISRVYSQPALFEEACRAMATPAIASDDIQKYKDEAKASKISELERDIQSRDTVALGVFTRGLVTRATLNDVPSSEA
ncbi:hypothetical protein JOM56_007618 [Amanita muscaria]